MVAVQKSKPDKKDSGGYLYNCSSDVYAGSPVEPAGISSGDYMYSFFFIVFLSPATKSLQFTGSGSYYPADDKSDRPF